MPLYEFECIEHGRFERLYPLSEWYVEWVFCSVCERICERVHSVVSMRPDSNWHFGETIKGKEINSRSKILRAKKQAGIIQLGGQRDIDDMKRAAAEGQRDKEQKLERENRRHFEETFSNTGVVGSFGEVTPDALRNQGGGDIKGEFSANELAK